MPFSFTEIEQQKTKTIQWVFIFLLFFYLFSFLMVYLISKNVIFYYYTREAQQAFYLIGPTLKESVIILGISLFVIVWQWRVATGDLIKRFIEILGAEPLNPQDKYHQMLGNIVQEVSVATGGRQMQAVVVPTMAMNAFTLSDHDGQSVIGVTEGLLARLTRAQLESVVAHEAAHIVSGDSLETTVVSSLFEVYNALIEGVEKMLAPGPSRISARSDRTTGILLLPYFALVICRFMASLLRMFVSREREYRADAIAVRLTRDPQSLAEALYSITSYWKLQGMASAELDSIFIVSPSLTPEEEGETFWDELFQTHPPVLKRVDVLLNMAHIDLMVLAKDVSLKAKRARVKVPQWKPAEPEKWFVFINSLWQGPFLLEQIVEQKLFGPEMWVKRVSDNVVRVGYEDDILSRRHISNLGELGACPQKSCPKCCVALVEAEYEGVLIYRCPQCDGILVKDRDANRIMIRPEYEFDERIAELGNKCERQMQKWYVGNIKHDPATLFCCPKCDNRRVKMVRMFYSAAYQVEIDKCVACDYIWFDRDELEILQFMIEKRSMGNV